MAFYARSRSAARPSEQSPAVAPEVPTQAPAVDGQTGHIKTLGIAVVNRGDLLLRCVESVDAPIENLVIVNNGGLRDVALACEAIFERRVLNAHIFKNIGVYRPARNLGAAGAWNHVFRTSPGPWLIAGNDVAFHAGAIVACDRAVSENPDATVLYADGYSVFVMTELGIAQVGYFDESFWPAYFEDDDHYYRSRLAHAKQVRVDGCGCAHEKSATIKQDPTLNNYKALLNHYVEKWGGPPGGEAWTVPYNGRP